MVWSLVKYRLGFCWSRKSGTNLWANSIPYNREKFYSNYLSIANVPGTGSNFNREERYLTESQCKDYNFKLKNNESISKIISEFYLTEGYKIEGDSLFICPTMRYIEEISNNIYENIKNNVECLLIEKGDEWPKVLAWRGLNRNKKRVVIIRYAKNYSNAADTLMLYSKDPDAEAYENEKNNISTWQCRCLRLKWGDFNGDWEFLQTYRVQCITGWVCTHKRVIWRFRHF